MTVVIRAAQADDAYAICELQRASIVGLCSAFYTTKEVDAWIGRLTPDKYSKPLSEQVMFVAEIESRVVGFSQLDATGATVKGVYVSPTATRSLVGTKLLQKLEAVALQLGIKHLELDATLNAAPFYEHLGYKRLQMTGHPISEEIALACVRMEKWL